MAGTAQRSPAEAGSRRVPPKAPMSYEVLARKWRPQTFDDVCAQTHVTRTLANALASGKLAHAILLSGPRGVVLPPAGFHEPRLSAVLPGP